MLQLLNQYHTPTGTFETYGSLIEHIHKIELSRLDFLNRMHSTLQHSYVFEGWGMWRFIVYRHEELKEIYAVMDNPPLTGIEREAFEQKLGLVEVRKGSVGLPVRILLTEDLDIRALQKDWCESYCEAHGYSILEDLNSEIPSGLPTAGGSDDLDI